MSSARYVLDRARWVIRAWGPNRRWIPVLAFLTVLSSAVALGYPLVFGHVLEEIDKLTTLSAADRASVDARIRSLVGVLLAIGAARFLVGFYPAFRALVNNRIEWFVRARTFARVLEKGQAFFTRFRTGDLVTRLTDDISGYPKIAWFSCSGLFRALESGSRVACCLLAMFWLDPALAAWSLLPVPLMIAVYFALQRRMRRAVEAQRAAASETSDYLETSFSGISVLQAMNAEQRVAGVLGAQLERRAATEVRLARLWVMFSIFFQALNVVGQLVVVVVGGLRVIDGTLPLGTFFSFYLFLGLLLGPMMDLPNLLVTGRQAFVCMDRLDELDGFDRAGEGGAFRGQARLERFEELAARGLSFTYPERSSPPSGTTGPAGGPPGGSTAPPPGVAPSGPPFSLAEVELELRRGERVALVGEVGAGKTTLLRLLAGVLAPGAGAVTLGGRPLADYHGPSVRARVGLVPQDPVLFAASVRENILMGRPEDPARLAQALELAGLSDEVAALPDGLDHELGVRGSGLSGGQRQRLTVARALYGEPELLLLDDITAALDAENEERFWERVSSERPGTTILVVTHRAATAERMERVLRLEQGRLEQVRLVPA